MSSPAKAASAKATSKKTSQGFKTYISKVLKQVHPDTSIKASTLSQLNGITDTLANILAGQAQDLARGSTRVTVMPKDVEAAARLVFPGELAKHAQTEGQKAVTKFSESEASGSKASRSGLQVPPSLAKRYLARSNLKSGENASVYLAAVLEYFLAEVLELAGNASRDYKKHQITPRHVYLGVHNDTELSRLFNDNNIRILGGGVLPNIDASLIPSEKEMAKKARKRNKARKARGDAPADGHRKLPGTKSRREIRDYQKTGANIISAARFKREVRDTLVSTYEGAHMSGEVANDVQRLVEDDIVRLLRRAISLMVHASRKKLSAQDVMLANQLSERPLTAVPLSADSNLPDPALKRLAQRAGSVSTNKDAFETLRPLVKGAIVRYVGPAAIMAQHHKMKTFTPALLSEAARAVGVNVPVENVPPKKRTSDVSRKVRASPRKSPSEGTKSPKAKPSPKKAAGKKKTSPKKKTSVTKKGSAGKAAKKASTPKK